MRVRVLRGTELPNNNACWEIAKKVWPVLKDTDSIRIKNRYIHFVSDIALDGLVNTILTKAEAEEIKRLLEEWRRRDEE